MGKVLLASLPDDELRKRIAPSSFAGTWGPNAIRNMTSLKKELAVVRERGFAYQDEEQVLDPLIAACTQISRRLGNS